MRDYILGLSTATIIIGLIAALILLLACCACSVWIWTVLDPASYQELMR